jgi:tetratricopeptide (TPR) repeat protein
LLYMAVGRDDQAIAHFSESVRLSPAVAATHFNLATVLAAAGHINEAISEYRRALELKPDYAFAHNNLGSVLFAVGNVDEAVAHVRRALEITPAYADAEYNLARILVVQEGSEAAMPHYRRALELRPDWLPVLGETSWLLATDPTARLRDPAAAVRYAERAVVLSKGSDPVSLDILAAAYAASGRFEQAINSAKKASELTTDGVAQSVLRERLARYKEGRPFVDIRRDGPIRP